MINSVLLPPAVDPHAAVPDVDWSVWVVHQSLASESQDGLPEWSGTLTRILDPENNVTMKKIAKLGIPIFKAGDRYSCDNYRPISLLSTISNILEKIVANSLVNHLELNNLLYENQFGFLRN